MTSARVSYGATEGVSGSKTGAQIGGKYGGPMGAMYGAIIGGFVGTVTGIAMGGKINKARSYKKQAAQIQQMVAAIQQDREREAYRQSLLLELRQDRIQRASNLAASVAAGIEEGSGSQGALSAIGSGISNVIQYMANDRAKVEQMQMLSAYADYMNQKAGKKYKAAQNIKRVADPLNLSQSKDAGEDIANISGTQAYSYKPSIAPGDSSMSGIGEGIGSQMGDWFGQSGFSFGGMGG